MIVSLASKTSTVAASVVNSSSNSFGINIACAHCSFKAGETVNITWISFAREYFGAGVGNGPLSGVQSVLGPLVNEVWQPFRPKYAAQTVRLVGGPGSDAAHVELVSDIGPLDPGRELVTRFDTSLHTQLSPTTGLFVVCLLVVCLFDCWFSFVPLSVFLYLVTLAVFVVSFCDSRISAYY